MNSLNTGSLRAEEDSNPRSPVSVDTDAERYKPELPGEATCRSSRVAGSSEPLGSPETRIPAPTSTLAENSTGDQALEAAAGLVAATR